MQREKQPVSVECILACVYFMCLPFTVVETPVGSLLKLVTFPVVFILGIRFLMGKSEPVFNYIHLTYAVYILYTVGLLMMYSADIAVVTTKDMVLGFMMLLLISVHVYNGREKNLIETAWIFVGLVCIFLCLTSGEVSSKYESRTVVRVFGFEEDQNQFCAYLIMPVLVSLKRMFSEKKLRFFYGAIIVLAFYSILKTGSRGGLIGVFAGAFVFALIGIKSVKTRIAVIVCGGFAVFAFVTVVMPMLPEDVAARYSVAAVTADGGTGRVDIWKFLLNYLVQTPGRMIHGSGLFSTYDIMHSAGFRNGVAHNAYIQILSDEGIIGLLLFLIVPVLCFTRNLRENPLYSCAVAALAAFSVSLTFYVFKPYLNILIMCAMSFEGSLPQDRLAA